MSDTPRAVVTALEIGAVAGDALSMDDTAFAAFYESTARPLWRYLARVTGDPRTADELLHEAYYRLLRVSVVFDDEDHRRRYLFRVAANLARDAHRQKGGRPADVSLDDATGVDSTEVGDARAVARLDLRRALARLTPRDRSLLWLAYVDGQSHEELASVHGVTRASLKMLLHRARRRLAGLLSAPAAEGGRR